MSEIPRTQNCSAIEFDVLFESFLDSDGVAQLLRIHPKTLAAYGAAHAHARANVRCSGKWHNRHWQGVGAARRGCRNDSLD
jgi:hypothetical protein